MTNPISQKFIRASLYFFLIGGILGALLRYQLVDPLPGIKYKFLLHGHSHVILLGWVFNALLGLSIDQLEKLGFQISQNFWNILFWLIQLSVIGMLIFFPIQGYAAFSIVFSTLHILLSLIIFIHLIKIKALFRPGLGFFTWAWVFFIFSAIGPFYLGVLISNGMAGSRLYYLTIYYYLHFLYNGFFLFSLFWIFLEKFKSDGLKIKNSRLILVLLVISCIGGFFLSTIWTFPPVWARAIAWGAGIIQFLVLIILIGQRKTLVKFYRNSAWSGRLLLSIASLALVLKFVLQLLSANQSVAYMAYRTPYFIIAYIHLVFIGLVSFSLFYLIQRSEELLLSNRFQKIGIISVIFGFILSEVLLISQPLGLTNYYLMLFLVSCFMPLGLILIVSSNKSGR